MKYTKLNKSVRKKLRLEYERLEGLKYVKEINTYQDPSWFDWVSYMRKQGEDWRRNRGLIMIEVSTHSKYITEKDLLEWDNSLKGDNKVKRLINKSVSE